MPGSPRAHLSPASDGQQQVLEAVRRLHPRVAVFDCDGTLWAGDGGEDFLDWEIENQVISSETAAWVRGRYASYRRGEVGEEQMCGEMVALHQGLPLAAVEAAAQRFFSQVLEPRIFSEMQALTHELAAAGCKVWAVSSTNEWVIQAGARRFAIPPERVIAASVAVVGGTITGKLIRVPTDEGKATALREVIGAADVVFGNSMHDAAMMVAGRHALAIHPGEELLALAKRSGWAIFYPR